jgi:hypothetical protein
MHSSVGSIITFFYHIFTMSLDQQISTLELIHVHVFLLDLVTVIAFNIHIQYFYQLNNRYKLILICCLIRRMSETFGSYHRLMCVLFLLLLMPFTLSIPLLIGDTLYFLYCHYLQHEYDESVRRMIVNGGFILTFLMTNFIFYRIRIRLDREQVKYNVEVERGHVTNTNRSITVRSFDHGVGV